MLSKKNKCFRKRKKYIENIYLKKKLIMKRNHLVMKGNYIWIGALKVSKIVVHKLLLIIITSINLTFLSPSA